VKITSKESGRYVEIKTIDATHVVKIQAYVKDGLDHVEALEYEQDKYGNEKSTFIHQSKYMSGSNAMKMFHERIGELIDEFDGEVIGKGDLEPIILKDEEDEEDE